MGDYVIFVPQIDSASVTPNPVDANASFKISVSVSEMQKILHPEWYYSGEVYAGESEA